MAGGSGLISRSWFTVDEFLDRAQIVLSSPIARREDLATVGTTAKFIATLAQDGSTNWRMERDNPREADIESSAARARPLFLKTETVYHGNVTTAIGALAQGAPQSTKDIVKLLKKAWAGSDGSYRWSFGTAMSVGDRPGPAELRTDRQIARDFLYGDLVHADVDARLRLRMIPEGERLQAATVWVADAIRLTEATRRLITDLQDAGCLTPRP